MNPVNAPRSLRAWAACALIFVVVGCGDATPNLVDLIQTGNPKACERAVSLLEADIRDVPMPVLPPVENLPDLVHADVAVTIRNPGFVRHDPTRRRVHCEAEVALAWANADQPFNDNIAWDERTKFYLWIDEDRPMVVWEPTTHIGWGVPPSRYRKMAADVHAAVLTGQRSPSS